MSNKQCIVLGCHKELPEGAKFPICKYHAGEAKEKAEAVAAVVVTTGVGAFAFVKKNGPAFVKENLPKAIDLGKNIIGKKL